MCPGVHGGSGLLDLCVSLFPNEIQMSGNHLDAYPSSYFFLDQKVNGEAVRKTSGPKRQKQHQRSRKDKPQQHNFTHPLLAAALKVTGISVW